jgi:hypothetical protein
MGHITPTGLKNYWIANRLRLTGPTGRFKRDIFKRDIFHFHRRIHWRVHLGFLTRKAAKTDVAEATEGARTQASAKSASEGPCAHIAKATAKCSSTETTTKGPRTSSRVATETTTKGPRTSSRVAAKTTAKCSTSLLSARGATWGATLGTTFLAAAGTATRTTAAASITATCCCAAAASAACTAATGGPSTAAASAAAGAATGTASVTATSTTGPAAAAAAAAITTAATAAAATATAAAAAATAAAEITACPRGAAATIFIRRPRLILVEMMRLEVWPLIPILPVPDRSPRARATPHDGAAMRPL